MYLTAKHRAAIQRSIWEMRQSEIEAAFAALPSCSPRSRKRLLLLALKAACDAKLEGAMAPIGKQLLTEFRLIPPAFYGTSIGAQQIYFSGTKLPPNQRAEKISLALIHPQIYR